MGIPFGDTDVLNLQKNSGVNFNITYSSQTNSLLINSGMLGESVKHISLYSLNGKLLKSIDYNFAKESTNKIHIPMGNISTGTTIVRVDTYRDEVFNFKVFIK